MKILTGAMSLLFSIAMSMHATANAIPSISLASSASPVGTGNAFSLAVTATDITDLYAYQFDLRFDPGAVQVLGIAEGNFLSDLGPSNFVAGLIDNNAGSVTYVANSMVGSIFGRSGSGFLLDFQMLATGNGVTTVSLPNLLLLNSSFEELVVVSSQADIIISPTAVSQPGTLLLLVAGLFAAYGASRLRDLTST